MTVSSPGRVNIIGEHVDYNDGFVLPFAISKRTWVDAKRSEKFVISSRGYGRVEISSLKKTGKWTDYVTGVLKELESSGFKVPPVEIKIWSDLPAGSGLSSSAALETAVAFAISELLNLKLGKMDIVNISVRAERNFVGVQCGVMDQYTAVFSRKGQAMLLDTMKITHEYIPLNLNGLSFALIDSKVKHSLSSGEYNKRREETRRVLEILKKSSYRDVKIKDLEKISDTVLKKRAIHVLEETKRVVRAAEFLRSGKMKDLGELLYESHESLSELYEVSCDETDFIVEFLKKNGIIGARMIGGGFGGNVLVLDREEKIKRIFKKMSDEYFKAFKTKPTLMMIESDDGARIEGRD